MRLSREKTMNNRAIGLCSRKCRERLLHSIFKAKKKMAVESYPQAPRRWAYLKRLIP